MFRRCIKPLAVLLMWGVTGFILMGTARAQRSAGSLQGKVFDPSGAVIPGARVEILRENNKGLRILTSDKDGNFFVAGLASGTYTVHVSHAGFATFISAQVRVMASKVTSLNARSVLESTRQQVSVLAEPGHGVSLAPNENASTMTLRGADLEALPDDPEELRADLKALAGPTVDSK